MAQVVFPRAPSVRYPADSSSRALICLDPEAETFVADFSAEIVNESYTGCSLILPTMDPLEPGAHLICQVEPLAPLRAAVIWCRRSDDQRLAIGLRYTE